MTQEIQGYQRKEKAFQVALEDAQAQILKYKYAESAKPAPVVNPIVPQECALEKMEPQLEMRQLEHQHALLKEQFEEKGEALSKARKELFLLESQLAVLQKESEEKMAEVSAEELAFQMQFQALTDECQDLEAQVAAMEEIITGLLVTKKAPAKPRKAKSKAKKDLLPDILQDAIDQQSNQFSLLE